MSSESETIRESVIRGEIAIFRPSFFPYLRVSEKIKVIKGPGVSP